MDTFSIFLTLTIHNVARSSDDADVKSYHYIKSYHYCLNHL